MIIKVFVIDGSATMRATLKSIFNDSTDIHVIGVASTADIALKKMSLHIWPDVILSTLDSANTNNINFLKHIKNAKSTPFVFLSKHNNNSPNISFEALHLGASEIIQLPNGKLQAAIISKTDIIKQSIHAAIENEHPSFKSRNVTDQTNNILPVNLIAIGSSTGGTTIIEKLLTTLPKQCPPVLVVQHMPYPFTQAFAKRLDTLCEIKVKQAEQGEQVQPGVAYIAQGSKHMELKNHKGTFRIVSNEGAPKNHHRPSIDTLFLSISTAGVHGVMGILLTGMGKDGSKGLLAMRQQGYYTIVQEPSDCAVCSMPKAALSIGAARAQLTIKEILKILRNIK